MNTQDLHVLGAVLVAAATTFATRAAPFVLFGRKRGIPPIAAYLGTHLPPAILAMLVVYGLKDVQPLVFPYGIPEALALLAVAGLHLWRRSVLLSVFGGTALYMVLVQAVFVR